MLADTSVWLDLAKQARVESEMTRSMSTRFRRVRAAIEEHGQGDGRQAALSELDNLTHRVPLINQMATRNFHDVRELLANGRRLSPTPKRHERVVQRALDKRGPIPPCEEQCRGRPAGRNV